MAEEHTTVHVYNHFPLEATRVSLSPASRTCNHFVSKQALGLAICFTLRGAEARGGVEDKETSEDGSLNHAGRRPRFTRCQPRVLLSVAAQVLKLRSSNHTRSTVKPAQLKSVPVMLARKTPPARNILCTPHSELPPAVRDKGKQHEQRGNVCKCCCT